MHSPDVFKIDDDGLMTVQEEVVDGSRRAEIEEAALSCPTQSIRIVDESASGDARNDVAPIRSDRAGGGGHRISAVSKLLNWSNNPRR